MDVVYRIRVTEDGEPGDTIELVLGEELVVGRDPACGLVLEHRKVSGRHASLRAGPDGVTIQDLGSLTGILVDGQRVQQAQLGSGAVRIPPFTLQLLDPGADTASTAPQAEVLLVGLGALLSADSEDEATILRRMLQGLTTAFEADRGFVFRQGDEDHFEEVQRQAPRDPSGQDEPISQSVLRRVLDEGGPLLLTTAETEDLRLDIGSIGGDLRSIVAAPLGDPEERRIVYLDSRLERRRFTDADRKLLLAFTESARKLLASDTARRDQTRRADRLAEVQHRTHGDPELLGDSPATLAIIEDLARAAATPVTVLVSGETGTGKELAARLVHRRSPRAAAPFVAVNSAALPADLIESELFGYEKGAFSGAVTEKAGLVELADGGTLFLDEIGELPPAAQGKLLRVLQEKVVRRVGGHRDRPIDFRLVAATNRDLKEAVAAGEFREDLFYRVSVFQVRMPPLRARGQDVVQLARRFLTTIAREFGSSVRDIDDAGVARLLRHAWPGNVRELRNVIEQAVIRADGPVLGVRALAPALGEPPPPPAEDGDPDDILRLASLPTDLSEARRLFEQALVRRVLRRHEGNMQRAAAALGIARKSLYAKCRDLEIEFEDFRS